MGVIFIYYEEQIKREIQGIHICGCRCNERLNTTTDGSTCLTYTGCRRNETDTTGCRCNETDSHTLGVDVMKQIQQIKGDLKGIHIRGCRCNGRLKAKTD